MQMTVPVPHKDSAKWATPHACCCFTSGLPNLARQALLLYKNESDQKTFKPELTSSGPLSVVNEKMKHQQLSIVIQLSKGWW